MDATRASMDATPPREQSAAPGPALVAEPQQSGSPLEVFRVALRLGLTSFGGPIAHLGYFRREYVERRRWLDERAFADLVALCQFLPGPASSELGIAIGTRRAGIGGGLAAWLGFTLPSAVAMLLFGLYARSMDIASAGWVHGLKLAAVAVVALAVVSMARTLAPDWRRRAIAAAAAAVVLVSWTPFAQVAVIVAGAGIGWLVLKPHPAPVGGRLGGRGVSRRVGVAALAVFFGLLVGLPALAALGGGSSVAFFDAFYRAGALIFGGGHVVLPLLHSTVVDPGWVSNDLFLAGYGAAQAVPGPLSTFSAYLGTVSSAGPGGWAGGIVALLAIFLPAFLLVFAMLPFWEAVRGRPGVRRALEGTNAAVVGILAAALYTSIWTSAVESPLDVVAAAAGLALLWTGRVPPIAVVALCAVAGQLGA